MKRKLINQLYKWKESSCLKPLLLTGAKGVGKTYLAYDFAKSFYDRSVYINFERDKEVVKLLEEFFSNSGNINNEVINNGNKDYYNTIAIILQDILSDHFKLPDNPGSILIILDEIAEYPQLDSFIHTLLSTELFHSVIAISSVWNENRVPVSSDSYYHLRLYPMDFEEFLVAAGIEWYIEVIKEHYHSNKKIPEIVHKELLSIFDLYIQIGGMPLAVNEYTGTGGIFNVSEQHEMLVNAYLGAASKHNSESELLKINQIINTIDKQLLKDNKKFQFTLIRKGATYGLYEEAIEFLKTSYYGLSNYKLSDESLVKYFAIKDAGFEENDFSLVNVWKDMDDINKNHSFKLYLIDVGLLNTMYQAQFSTDNEAAKKALYENYVAQSLLANGYPLYFWESNSQAKLDFIIHKNNQFIPIEVRTNDNTRSKNVSIFRSKFDSEAGKISDSIKISTRNFELSNQVKYVPIYAVFCI